ncbi:hypothetical protein CANARDRAFT_28565 [[Candida] arabinofermentans NRRL YB-2248]|uniref:CMP/dCMP-type deaminase domain-containing protein n=1 Tax=[Candida] arabinofermentans NRRL YB-2248 TaxID=983967 RepID=A0A1E4T0M5_9ASCO|nr:hypothetical protein CANARDRAFT_28565 [[Candida] arabinofermentans NRRL YB-2248]
MFGLCNTTEKYTKNFITLQRCMISTIYVLLEYYGHSEMQSTSQIPNNYDIDYENLIFYKNFQRIQPSQNQTTPNLAKYWITYIKPQDSNIINNLIKDKFKDRCDLLKHLKTFMKVKVDDTIYLKALLCDCESVNYTEIKEIVSQALIESKGITQKIKIEKADIPLNKPFDKDLNKKWSSEIWPIVWKGNPMIQELHESYKSFKVENDLKYIKLITELANSKHEDNQLPVVTIFVDPKIDRIISTQLDTRSPQNPIKHSIMNCIEEIAENECCRRKTASEEDSKASSNNYLCLNYHVYTTHEPCTMCSMALLHSRIDKLVYIKDSTITGSIGRESGNGYMIHLSCSLNWKFESFKYIGDQYNAPSIDEYIEV